MITPIILVNSHHHTQLQIFFLVIRNSKVYFLSNIQIYNTVFNYSHHAVYYMSANYLIKTGSLDLTSIFTVNHTIRS